MSDLDLKALRERAEHGARSHDSSLLMPLHPSALLALLDRLEAAERERDSANQSDRIKTGEINVLTRENRALRTAIEEFDPLVVLENGLPADPTSLDWWDAEPGDLCRAIADSAIGLRAALAPSPRRKVMEGPELKAALDCQRCGCSWNTTALFMEPGTVYTCCPACGWLSEQEWPDGEVSHALARGTIVFDASDPEQRQAVQSLGEGK